VLGSVNVGTIKQDQVPAPSPTPTPTPGGGGTLNTKLMLFSGHDYLGCLNCSAFASDSVCNSFGTYGNSFSSTSIWNSFGSYGSRFESRSPWNSFATSPPVVVDSNGGFYGYFTLNTAGNPTSIIALRLVLDFARTTTNLTTVRSFMCGS